MPPVSRYMTPAPTTIVSTDPMSRAHAVMEQRHVHHLPVVDGGRLVGIVTERDLHRMESFDDVDPEVVTVAEVMTDEVYTVRSTVPLDAVVSQMIERRLGSAVVVGPGGIEGIFTALDGLRALVDVLGVPPERA